MYKHYSKKVRLPALCGPKTPSALTWNLQPVFILLSTTPSWTSFISCCVGLVIPIRPSGVQNRIQDRSSGATGCPRADEGCSRCALLEPTAAAEATQSAPKHKTNRCLIILDLGTVWGHFLLPFVQQNYNVSYKQKRHL